MVREYVMVGAGILSVPTLGDGALILRDNLDGAGVSTLGGAVPPKMCAGDVCTTLGGSPGLFSHDLNRVANCLRDTNWVSPMCANGVSVLVCSNTSVKYAASIGARS